MLVCVRVCVCVCVLELVYVSMCTCVCELVYVSVGAFVWGWSERPPVNKHATASRHPTALQSPFLFSSLQQCTVSVSMCCPLLLVISEEF